MTHNGQEGTAGIVNLASVLLVMMVAVAGIAAAGDLSATAARARAAADAAALAGAGVSPLAAGGAAQSPGRTAETVARANRAQLVGEDTSGWPLRYAVTVEVEPATRWVREIVGPVRAEAVAALRPRP